MKTNDLTAITPAVLRATPSIISTLRMSTAPPIARDRLIGLAYTSASLVKTMGADKLPPRLASAELTGHLDRICAVLAELLDIDLFGWLKQQRSATADERLIAATVVADRLCGSQADPIVRNAQEQRQLALIEEWLLKRGYVKKPHPATQALKNMQPGTFSFRQIVVIGGSSPVNIPIDVVIQPHTPYSHRLPLLIEAKSAGDFTNTNKRRKEEATKIRQLKDTYGNDIGLLLFLCGYFDGGYLGYEAAEGLDWVWEHRVDDLAAAGV